MITKDMLNVLCLRSPSDLSVQEHLSMENKRSTDVLKETSNQLTTEKRTIKKTQETWSTMKDSSEQPSNNRRNNYSSGNNNRTNNYYDRNNSNNNNNNNNSSGYYRNNKNGYQYNNNNNNNNNYNGGNRGSKKVAHPKLDEKAKGTLNKEKTEKLNKLMEEEYEISSKDGTISFKVSMTLLLKKLRKKLWERRIIIISIRLVGSGASFVVSENIERDLNDLDFSFYITDGGRFFDILEIEEDVLGELMEQFTGLPYDTSQRREIYDKFCLDSVKVESGIRNEAWSLITIGKKQSQTIDIKFVYKSKRSYVFSTDSFEVVFDNLFPSPREEQQQIESKNNNEPVITVESIYGNYDEAIKHMNDNILCTNNPEEIRRGIFRYSYELAKGKKPKSEEELHLLDKTFTDSFLAEENIQFEEILAKFLQKHSANASLFLKELSNVLTRSSAGEKSVLYLDIISKYRSQLSDTPQIDM